MVKTEQSFGENSEYICKDDIYYEEIILENFIFEINMKGGRFEYEI